MGKRFDSHVNKPAKDGFIDAVVCDLPVRSRIHEPFVSIVTKKLNKNTCEYVAYCA
jgi:hypothetical protein